MSDAPQPPRREPLWASSLADAPGADDVTIHRVETDADRPPEGAEPSTGRRAGVRLAATLLVAALLGVLAIVADDASPLPTQRAPSFWLDTAMTCTVSRLQNEGRTIELFTCRAVGAGTLPVGTYASPDITWNSDIDRREAQATDIDIAPDGVLTGWAAYG